MNIQHLPHEGLSTLCLQLSQFLHSGISPEEGLAILSQDAQDQQEQALLKALADRMEAGESLSAALAAQPEIPPYLTQMVQLGERSGTMETVLQALSGYYHRESKLQESIKSAVVYPAIMACAMGVLLLVLSLAVLPAFADVFSALGLALTPASALLMNIGRWVAPVAAVAILVLGVAAVLALSNPQRREGILRRTALMKLAASGHFISALALMLRSGLDLGDSLERASALSGNDAIAAAGHQAARQVEDDGASITDALSGRELLSGAHLRMLRVGERTGGTDRMLEEIAQRLANDVEVRTDRLLGRVEPAIVTSLSVLAGLILLTVMLPLLSVLSTVG